MWCLGHLLGHEDLYNEYKELCLYNLNIFFDNDEIYNFVRLNIPINKIKWNKTNICI